MAGGRLCDADSGEGGVGVAEKGEDGVSSR